MKGQIFIQFVVLDPLIRFAHVMIMLGEELPSLPPLTVRHWFFIIQIFEQLSCSEKQSCHETFYCVEIFFIFQDFWATCGLPWKTVCREFTALNIYIFIHSEFWTTCACTENRFCPEIFHCIEIFFIFQDFWATWACPDNRVCPEFFKPGKWPPPASYATGSVHYRFLAAFTGLGSEDTYCLRHFSANFHSRLVARNRKPINCMLKTLLKRRMQN